MQHGLTLHVAVCRTCPAYQSHHRYAYSSGCHAATTTMQKYIFKYLLLKLNKQESLANANVSARQQCMYEGRYRRNLSSVENTTVEANIIHVSIL